MTLENDGLKVVLINVAEAVVPPNAELVTALELSPTE